MANTDPRYDNVTIILTNLQRSDVVQYHLRTQIVRGSV